MTKGKSVLICCILTMYLVAEPTGAQNELRIDEEIDFNRTESWAMKYFASVNLFTGLGVPRGLDPGSVEIGFELDWVPRLSESERTVGFDGTKTEDLNRTEVFGRPRLEIGLPWKLSVALSWVPPIEVNDVEPNLFSASLARPVWESERWRLGLRIFGQYGTLEGDFTCPRREAAAGDNLDLNPFRCEEPSEDTMKIRSSSLELGVAYAIGQSQKWEPYATAAINSMNLDFQVNARYNNIVDHTRLLTDGETWYGTVGFRYTGWQRAMIGFEVFYSELEVIRPPSTSVQSNSLFNARTYFSIHLR